MHRRVNRIPSNNATTRLIGRRVIDSFYNSSTIIFSDCKFCFHTETFQLWLWKIHLFRFQLLPSVFSSLTALTDFYFNNSLQYSNLRQWKCKEINFQKILRRIFPKFCFRHFFKLQALYLIGVNQKLSDIMRNLFYVYNMLCICMYIICSHPMY